MTQRKSDAGNGTARHSTTIRRRHLIWRITPDAPQGRYFDADELARQASRPAADIPVDPEAERELGWRQSSFDLAHGLEVSDDPDTVPAALFDELFRSKSGR